MSQTLIQFEQLGAAPDKSECQVRWIVNRSDGRIVIKQKSSGSWGRIGDMSVDELDIIDRSFDSSGVWEILRYENNGETYKLTVEGPERINKTYFYHMKIRKVTQKGQSKTVDDSLISDMPELDIR